MSIYFTLLTHTRLSIGAGDFFSNWRCSLSNGTLPKDISGCLHFVQYTVMIYSIQWTVASKWPYELIQPFSQLGLDKDEKNSPNSVHIHFIARWAWGRCTFCTFLIQLKNPTASSQFHLHAASYKGIKRARRSAEMLRINKGEEQKRTKRLGSEKAKCEKEECRISSSAAAPCEFTDWDKLSRTAVCSCADGDMGEKNSKIVTVWEQRKGSWHLTFDFDTV